LFVGFLVLYRQARTIYWRVLKPRLYEQLRQHRERLRKFVPAGSLVFDVGANVGEVTAVLLDIGARPVAIEPNSALADIVSKRYGVPVECAAVGAEEGEAVLHVGRDPGHSTLSEEWHALHLERWRNAVSVPVTTLDRLIERYGLARFIKIDVEGYEPQVLRGLSQPVDVISLEFQRQLPEATFEALEQLGRLGDYQFQYVVYTHDGASELQPHEPVSASPLERMLGELPDHAYGDLYAVRR
jgi:FkbM family methyltransferase